MSREADLVDPQLVSTTNLVRAVVFAHTDSFAITLNNVILTDAGGRFSLHERASSKKVEQFTSLAVYFDEGIGGEDAGAP